MNMPMRIIVLLLGIFFLEPIHGFAAGSSRDPDGGLARAYFKPMKIRPMKFVDQEGKKPNIIWIVVDALRPDHLGMYGYDKPTSKFLDEWAKDSFVFLNMSTNAPWTRSSTASMLTGLWPSAHRTQSDRNKLPAGITTLAQLLRKQGYRTAAVVGNGNAGQVANLNRGFDDYVDTVTHWIGLPDAAQVYDDALVWLKTARPSGQPWFLFLFLVDPHDPYHAPPEYEKHWIEGIEGKPRRRAHWEYKNKYPANERRSMQALYDASINYTDDQTQRFFGELKKLGAEKNTAFVFTADHGEGFGEHGYFLHSYHHYDEFLRVPLIIRSPRWKGSGHVFHATQMVDIAPTLLGWAGGKAPKNWPGRDLSLLLSKPVNRQRITISEYNEFGIRRSSIFDLEIKVIVQLPADKKVFLHRIPRTELLPSVNFEHEVVQVFDRQKDPFEKSNLFARVMSSRVMLLLEKLRSYMKAASKAGAALKKGDIPKQVLEDLRSLGYVQ